MPKLRCAPSTVDNSPDEENTTMSPETDIETEIRVESVSESQSNQHPPVNGLLQISAQKQRDPTHVIVRRFTDLAALTSDLEANYLEQLGQELRRMIQEGEDGVEEFNEKVMVRLGRYHQFAVHFRSILGLDEPSNALFRNVIHSARASVEEKYAHHLWESDEDWTPLYDTEKFERLFTLWPHLPIFQRILKPFRYRTERTEAAVELAFFPPELVQFVIVGVFNCFVGVFVAAPVAIQVLNVTSPMGEAVTYLTFVIVAGFLIQTLVKGFTKQLLVYLAYAGVMAAVMRQRD
ncbi:hypothetical protein ACJ41O_013430 [Fusarium nematophilum]